MKKLLLALSLLSSNAYAGTYIDLWRQVSAEWKAAGMEVATVYENPDQTFLRAIGVMKTQVAAEALFLWDPKAGELEPIKKPGVVFEEGTCVFSNGRDYNYRRAYERQDGKKGAPSKGERA